MNKLFVCLALLCPALAASESWRLPESSIVSNHAVEVYHSKRGFSVLDASGTVVNVARHDLDGDLRRVKIDNIRRYLGAGKIQASRMSDGSYVLRSHIPGHGAGPLAGIIGYCVTKAAACIGAGVAIAVSGPAAPIAVASAPAVIGGIEASAAAVGGALFACPFLP